MAKTPKGGTKVSKKPTNPISAKAPKPKKPTSQVGKKRGRSWPPVPKVMDSVYGRNFKWIVAPDELQDICTKSGLEVGNDKLEPTAEKITLAFYYSIPDGVYTDRASSDRTWRDWCEAVHRQAEGFLELLAFPGGKETLGLSELGYALNPQSTFGQSPRPSPLALVNGTFHDEIDAQLWRLPVEVRETFQNPGYGLKVNAMKVAPWVIALLSEVGRLGAKQYAEPKRGRRGKIFKPMLLSRLAVVYEDLTGGPPSGTQDMGSYVEDTPPILWLRAVLETASQRLDSCFSAPQLDAIIQDIVDLSKQQDSTLIKQFRSSFTEKT